MSRRALAVPRSLVRATDLDVLPLNRVVERRSGFLLIRSPSNPEHFWGNLLLFDNAPRTGDALQWEGLFDEAFGDEPRVQHRTFAWDLTDGVFGAVREEFAGRGYVIEESIGLVASASEVLSNPRENREVVVQVLDPANGSDAALWDEVLELQVAGRDDGQEEETFRSFARTRLDDLRALFRDGRGAWYVAIESATGDVVGSCGVVVTAGRGRFQMVDTAQTRRRRGICSRLVVEAASRASADYGANRFVIVAEADYHALALYESLGFKRAERVFGACLWSRMGSPPSDAAN